jgi:amino acid adenylation domain-containing protein
MMRKKTVFVQEKIFANLGQYGDSYAIEQGKQRLTYSQLEERIFSIVDGLTKRGIQKQNLIGVFINDRIDLISVMLGILKAGCVFIPLDTMLPMKRIEYMLKLTATKYVICDEPMREKMSLELRENRHVVPVEVDQLLKSFNPSAFPGKGKKDIRYNPGDKVYIYFTSGSGGKPRAIVGQNKSLCHFINWEIDTFGVNEHFRFSQFITPGFDAFLRDILVPISTGGTICIPESKEILSDNRQLIDWIDANRIHLIHCVPSIFRMFNKDTLVPGNFEHLKYILMAGERIVPNELKHWFDTFGGRIRLVNLYGTTETTMAKTFYFIRESDVYKEKVSVGKPLPGARVIIFDRDMKPCGRERVGEIYIRTPYRTLGYLNDPELTHERFIRNLVSSNENDRLHRTGDIGKILADGSIEVIGRIDRQVKIQGMRVELEEIENQLRKHPGVQEAVIMERRYPEKSISNHEGEEKYLCAYYVPGYRGSFVSSPDDLDLRDFLLSRLPPFMIPIYFAKLEKIPLTVNGKVDWKGLPEPEMKKWVYIPPRNVLEEKLVRLWSEILGEEPSTIGINSDFFQLGGNSLKATTMISRIHKELDVDVPLTEVFRNSTVEKLARYVTGSVKNIFSAIDPSEKKEFYISSSAQKRLFFLQQMKPQNIGYNMPQTIPLKTSHGEGLFSSPSFEAIFKKLITRHESLKTSFELVNEEPVQRVRDEVVLNLETYDLNVEMRDDLMHEYIVKYFVRPFDLSEAPLLRVGLLKTLDDKKCILLVDMHHIITDGVSLEILTKEFMNLCAGEELKPLRLQYKDYSEWKNSKKQKERIKRQEAYWLRLFSDEIPALQLPTDHNRPVIHSFEGDSSFFVINKKETRGLKELAMELDATLFMTLLAVFSIFLSKLSGQEDILVGTAVAGRSHADLQHVIGMFVNTIVFRNYLSSNKTFKALVKEVKNRTLESYKNQDYPFEMLVEKLPIRRDTSRNPLFDVMFNMWTLDDDSISVGKVNENAEMKSLRKASKFDLTLYGFEAKDSMLFFFQYSTKLFKKSTIDKFMKFFKEIVHEVQQDPNMIIMNLNQPPLATAAHINKSSVVAREEVAYVKEKTYITPGKKEEEEIQMISGQELDESLGMMEESMQLLIEDENE